MSEITRSPAAAGKTAPRRTGSIEWLDSSDIMRSRGAELLGTIKKKTTSGKMAAPQMELCTKLAELMEVHEELEAEKLEAGASFLGTVPNPAWLSDPTPQPHWSLEETRLAGGDGPECNAGSGSGGKAPGLVRAPKIADALKSMIILMHPTLINAECMSGLGAEATEAGARLLPDAAAPPTLVAFHRVCEVTRLQATDQSVQLSAPSVPCRRYLAVLTCSKTVELLQAGALSRHAAALLRTHPGQLTVLIHDATSFLKEGARHLVLEEAIIDLLVSLGVDTLVVRAAKQLTALVLHAARALAEEPYKLSRRAVDEEAQFYMRGDNKNCVAVDAQGHGMGRLWQQMLSVLPQSSLEVGRALAAHCPTPRHMAQTVQSAAGAETLCDVPVARSAAPGARPRRLGPEMANKLVNIFTQDGDFKLD